MTARTRHAALPPNLPPRGLSREEAAAYVGVSATTFDGMIEAGTMPAPRKIEGRRVWDIREVDSAFSALPHAGGARDGAANSGSVWSQARA